MGVGEIPEFAHTILAAGLAQSWRVSVGQDWRGKGGTMLHGTKALLGGNSQSYLRGVVHLLVELHISRGLQGLAVPRLGHAVGAIPLLRWCRPARGYTTQQ